MTQTQIRQRLLEAYREYRDISLACHASGSASARRGRCLPGCRRAWVRFCGMQRLAARNAA